LQQTNEQFGCGNFTVYGPIKDLFGTIGYKCLFCGSYRCTRCRPPKLHKLRARIAQIANDFRLERMATLTLDPSRIPSGERSDQYIRECWRKMRVYIKREFGNSIDFISVLEFQESGSAHLHLLLNIYIPQAWLSEAWVRSGGGRIVDIRRFVKIHFVAAYLAGYLAGNKIAHTLSLLPRRARIFTTSRSIALWGKKKKTGWKLSTKRLWDLRARVGKASKERYEPIEDLKGFDLEILTYFEGPVIQQAIKDRDVFEALKAFIRVWKSEPPEPYQYELL
jgi:hypothetical protein